MENQYTYYKPEPDDMNGMNEETPKTKKEPKGAKTSETCMRRSCIWSCGKCNIPDRKLCGNKSVRHNNYKR